MSTYGEPIPYGVGGTYVETPTAIVAPTLKAVTADPYAVATAYGELVPYADSAVSVGAYSAENILTFSETASNGITDAEDVLTFEAVAGIIHAASNSLIFKAVRTAEVTEDILTFSGFAGGSTGLLVVDQPLTFIEEVTGLAAKGGTETLVFTGTAGLVTPAINELVFIEETTHVAASLGLAPITFEQEATWNVNRQVHEDQILRFFEVATYSVGNRFGSSGVTTLEATEGALTVGLLAFKMVAAYDKESVFTRGKYLNRSEKYSLTLGRPLDVVGDWQLRIRNLVGTKQLVTGLLQEPTEMFVSGESTLETDGMTLVLHPITHDTRAGL